jgi:hypothetical protein
MRLFLIALLITGFPLFAQNPPKREPQKTEPPKTEPPKTEPRKTDPPKTEPPRVEAVKTEEEKAKESEKIDTNAPVLNPYLLRRFEAFRFRVMAGAGYQSIKPSILSEAGPAWQLNSFIRAASNGTSQPALLIQDTKKVPAYRYKVSGDVAYKDRLFFDYERQWTKQDYSKKYPTRVTFAAPGNSTYETALYEGLRMLEYKEVTNNFSLTYLHPLGKGVKLGGYLEREIYHENLEISMGSLSLTKTNTLTWSQAGSIPADYRAAGNTIGFAARYLLFEWLGFYYRINPIRRSGDFKMSGPQIMNIQTGTNGPTSLSIIVPVDYAQFSDKGIRHRLEASVRFFCRYYAVLGFLKEDYKRNYSIYVGNSFATIGGFTPKTSGLGIGEMSQAHKASKLEVYLKFGAAFFL